MLNRRQFIAAVAAGVGGVAAGAKIVNAGEAREPDAWMEVADGPGRRVPLRRESDGGYDFLEEIPPMNNETRYLVNELNPHDATCTVGKNGVVTWTWAVS